MAIGQLNVMLACYVREPLDDTAVVVRIYGSALKGIAHRGNEVTYAKCVGVTGLGPKFYCSFKNGYCVGYVPGTTYQWMENNPFKDIKKGR